MSHSLLRTFVVITSINAPTKGVRAFGDLSKQSDWRMLVIGDKKGPKSFELDTCQLVTLEDQLASPFGYARSCPVGHYARKNVGYLMAVNGGAERIYETDDDNIPYPGFQLRAAPELEDCPIISEAGPFNVYSLFTSERIWPRGLPLTSIAAGPTLRRELPRGEACCPIIQGLADDNPDVDAIFRLTCELPVKFERHAETVVAAPGSWSPFNSQNTLWFRQAFPLMYLPAHCSFRMTDIWRSFVAQRIAWENGWGIAYDPPTVFQERNEHALLRDFEEEIPGYLHNERIISELDALTLQTGANSIGDNLRCCYERLVRCGYVGSDELALLDAWLSDLKALERD